MATTKITGLQTVLSNLNGSIRGAEKGARKGLIKSGAIIKASSVRNAPIDLGNLRSSHFMYFGSGFPSPVWKKGPSSDLNKLREGHIRAEGTAKARLIGNVVVLVGVSAHYAIFVHEAPPTTNFSQGGPRFLERAVEANKLVIKKIVQNEALLGLTKKGT